MASLSRISNSVLSHGGKTGMSDPIFKSIFGEAWQKLPTVMHKHYANRPYTDDEYTVVGKLDVMCKPPLIWLAPLMKITGQIPINNETSVPITVQFKSDCDTPMFHFFRTFRFKNGKPYIFHSRMIQIQDNEVVEIMHLGLCWKMKYLWDGGKIILQHNGYALKIFNHFISLPLTLLLGKGYAEEKAIDDNTFDMMTHISHPWWGKIYEYKGRFEVLD